ncbi:hypothetical protein [Microcoleus sp. AT9b-C3]
MLKQSLSQLQVYRVGSIDLPTQRRTQFHSPCSPKAAQ